MLCCCFKCYRASFAENHLLPSVCSSRHNKTVTSWHHAQASCSQWCHTDHFLSSVCIASWSTEAFVGAEMSFSTFSAEWLQKNFKAAPKKAVFPQELIETKTEQKGFKVLTLGDWTRNVQKWENDACCTTTGTWWICSWCCVRNICEKNDAL